MRQIALVPFALALYASSAHAVLAAPPRPAPTQCVAIIGTNDLHGAIEPYAITAPLGTGKATVRTGGVIGLSGYVQALRQHYGKRTVLVDGGDLFQGTLPSNMSRGKAVINAYNIIGYTASAVGNHEFDFGRLPGEADRIGVLKARIAEAQFPFLNLNVFERETGKRAEWPNTRGSLLMDAGGIKVGIMGISTLETPTVTKAENVSGLEFKDPVPLVRDEARALRAQGAQLVVLVGHVGGKCKLTTDPNDLSSCATGTVDGELMRILQALPTGAVDVAVGGHTHQFMAHWINGTATIESGARGHFLGYVEACVAPGGGIDQATSSIHGATPLCLDTWADGSCKKKRKAMLPIAPAQFLGQSVAPSAPLEAAMLPYLDAVRALGARPLGVRLPKTLGGPPLAELVAEAMRRATHADFGLQNRGGVRADLPAGPLNYGQVFQVLPFDNNVVRVTLTGALLEQMLTIIAQRHGYGFPPMAGLRMVRQGGQLRVFTGKGKLLEPKKRYTFSTSDFLVGGGEGLDVIFNQVPPEDMFTPELSMRDAFIDLLTAVYPE